VKSFLDDLTLARHSQNVNAEDIRLPRPAVASSRPTPAPLLATDIKVTGQPLDPTNWGKIVKPRELVDIIELTPLSRNESILYNQLLANAWNDIRTRPVHKVLKASLRGSHDSNDRLDEAFDKLMSAWAKIRARDPQTGAMTTYRIHLLGTNAEEEQDSGYFYYTFPPDLLAVISQSRAWATIKSHIMYALRSKYSIRLYEMIERRIGMSKNFEEIDVDAFRAYLGVPEGKLARFADFNKYALKPALEEVNHLTDFVVRVATIKRGRTVEKLLMSWDRKTTAQIEAAHIERERSRVGREARWSRRVEQISFPGDDE
jgi:plasmid replication initiation protein